FLDVFEFVFWGGLCQEVVNARFGGNRGRGERIVASDHDAANAHKPKLCDPFLHPTFHDVLQMDDAQQALSVRHCEWRSAVPRDAIADILNAAGHLAAIIANEFADSFGRSLS